MDPATSDGPRGHRVSAGGGDRRQNAVHLDPRLWPWLRRDLAARVFSAVLFGGEQFAFRDAGNFFYPLHLRVQQEWRSGAWPLWDAWQNGGQPLLGNPMAAVLYPGKLIYALLPYAWGAVFTWSATRPGRSSGCWPWPDRSR